MRKCLFISTALLILLGLTACSQETKIEKKKAVIEKAIEENSEYDLQRLLVLVDKEEISITIGGPLITDPLLFEEYVKEMLTVSLTAAEEQEIPVKRISISSFGGAGGIDRECFTWTTYDYLHGSLADRRIDPLIIMDNIQLNDIKNTLENSLANYATEMNGLKLYLAEKSSYPYDTINFFTGTANDQMMIVFTKNILKIEERNAGIKLHKYNGYENSIPEITQLVEEYLSETPMPVQTLHFRLVDNTGKTVESDMAIINK